MRFYSLFVLLTVAVLTCACGGGGGSESASAQAPADGGQSTVVDETSQPDVVKVAVNSKDHTTLVAAVKAAELVDELSNAGPFTVFAPVNAAFDQLPAGTVETLLKPENKTKLVDILQHHVYVGIITTEMIQDGMSLNMVDGTNITLSKAGDQVSVGKAKVVASVRASNGIVHVVDGVILPPQ